METVKIFDTTLRDGEQTPKVNLNKEDKVVIAKQLELLGVDIIEAGFPVSSEGDFEAVKAVADACKKATVCALARCVEKDIDMAALALKNAKNKRIHVFLATSEIHLKEKLKITKEKALEIIDKMVRYAKSKVDDIQFSAEDATRTEKEFLVKAFNIAIKAGATTINVPDTVGYSQPNEYFQLIKYIKENIENKNNITISVHCHDDLGLASSNALMGILGGARQVECTINGLGERAGNSSLEEVVMAIKTRKDIYNDVKTNIDTKQIYKTSKLVGALTNINMSPTKSVIGQNCFLHESGIHQDGILKNRKTYEIMDPQEIGLPQNDGIILGKHSGRHAFKAYLENLAINIEEDKLNDSFEKFKELTAIKKYITTEDILSIVKEDKVPEPLYKFISYTSFSNEFSIVEVTIKLKKGDKIIVQKAFGNGPVDASYKAINKIVKKDIEIQDYQIQAVSERSDSLGEAKIRMSLGDKTLKSTGLDKDIVKASIIAYINGINKLGINS